MQNDGTAPLSFVVSRVSFPQARLLIGLLCCCVTSCETSLHGLTLHLRTPVFVSGLATMVLEHGLITREIRVIGTCCSKSDLTVDTSAAGNMIRGLCVIGSSVRNHYVIHLSVHYCGDP